MKKWLSPYYSTYWCYIHQTCTNCSSWHDLLIPHGGLCPWPTFHAWVTMVRKKWLSLYNSTYWCYIHQTCTNCSSWHDLLIPLGGLCLWPTFHAWVTMIRKKWLSPYYSTYWCYIHQTCTNCSSWHDLLMPRGGLCPWPTFHASETKTQNGNSGAPVMVPITIMSSMVQKFSFCSNFYGDVLANFYLLHIFVDLKTVFLLWNMFLKLKSLNQIGTFIFHKAFLAPHVGVNFFDETRYSTSIYH